MPIVLAAFAYLLGTFPSATWIARANGVEISEVGSGNPGASNVTRALGWRVGIWVYVLDALKGLIAVGIALALDGRPVAYVCGFAAVLGHMFPVFRRFQGGKGVATASGMLIALHPVVAPFALALWWVTSKVTGKAAIGTLVAVSAVPIGLAVLGRPAWEYLAVAALSALILAKHWKNFVRIIRREEPALRGGS
ncbi:MAG: glycerol-3-phosphate 1-O-acyltransferase PlsY [Ilumatobacter sp.]